MADTEVNAVPVGGAPDEDDKIVINVGGIRHESLVSTLTSKPGTRLSYIAKRHSHSSPREYFFDRHPGVFNTVMDYYRSGELHVPLDVCGAVVKRELDFWQIDECLIEPCCWTCYSSYIDNQRTLAEFNQSVVQEQEQMARVNSLSGWPHTQMVIWMILDHPRSSRLALGYAVTSFLFVLASISGFCLETLPSMQETHNVTRECSGRNVTVSGYTSHKFLEYLDYICTAFFTIELVVRIVFAPAKIEFFRSVMNIIDILALLPLYVQIFLDLTDQYNCLKNHRAVLETIFILRIVRICRIFHLVKHYKALKILVHAIKASIQELLMLSIFLVIAMLVFSTLIFYAERDGPLEFGGEGDFQSIPIGFWYAIITMTTVGYGDVYPKTPQGCVIGAVCAVWGVLLVTLTIPVISNNFTLFYLHARTREGMVKKDTRVSPRSPPDEENGSVHTKVVSNKRHRGFDSKSLLNRVDSNSTTDESGVLLPRPGTEENATPDRAKPSYLNDIKLESAL